MELVNLSEPTGMITQPFWSAPETRDDNANNMTTAVDVYAFGIIFGEILTRKFPYEVSNAKLRE